MPTEMQKTPTLYGKDAQDVLDQIKKKPTAEQKKKAEECREIYNKIKKEGF